MAYTAHETFIGVPQLGTVDTTQGTGNGRVIRATDPTYGEGEFIYLKANGSLAAGNVVQFNSFAGTASAWLGTANTGIPIAVANTAMTSGQWGWFQISGNTVTTISGTVAAGSSLYWQANGTLSTTVVAGKQVMGAFAASANGVPANGQAIVYMSRPHVQGQIT